MALVVLVALIWLVHALARVPSMRTQARWLGALAALQLVSGLSNVVLDWPLVAAVGHTGGAAGLVVGCSPAEPPAPGKTPQTPASPTDIPGEAELGPL